jgi:hypothetical protein
MQYIVYWPTVTRYIFGRAQGHNGIVAHIGRCGHANHVKRASATQPLENPLQHWTPGHIEQNFSR